LVEAVLDSNDHSLDAGFFHALQRHFFCHMDDSALRGKLLRHHAIKQQSGRCDFRGQVFSPSTVSWYAGISDLMPCVVPRLAWVQLPLLGVGATEAMVQY